MSSRRRLLLLQLPRLDPDVTTAGENVMLAAGGLKRALAGSVEGRHWEVLATPAAQDVADNAGLLSAVERLEPHAIGATLYLWNVERTLRLLGALRRRQPGLRTIVGGPEVSADHPLLTRAAGRVVDVAVVGEGEAVLPDVLAAWRRGGSTAWANVGWSHGRRFRWGHLPPPMRPLADVLPHPNDPCCGPDAQGMAYIETSRGCPMRCAFCCYSLRRRQWTGLSAAEVEQRIRRLRRRGTREIRLVDPTFNAHPRFRSILDALCRANRDRGVRFFAELRADTLTEEDAAKLAEANVVEAEVGVQSTDPVVLRAVHRPTDLERTLAGIERLQRHGNKPTIDFMYGLPRQGMDDIRRALATLQRFPDAHQQFLPTLLLPGTELRGRARELGLRAQRLPPYRVLSTRRLPARRLAQVERMAEEALGGFDSPTRRFVGARLLDLFKDRQTIDLAQPLPPLASGANRRCLIFRGGDLFARRADMADCIRMTVRREPDVLWQYVLEVSDEEPLDLLDNLTTVIRRLPSHWLDRLVSPPGIRRLSARRLFVRLPGGRAFDQEWIEAAEELLRGVFH